MVQQDFVNHALAVIYWYLYRYLVPGTRRTGTRYQHHQLVRVHIDTWYKFYVGVH